MRRRRIAVLTAQAEEYTQRKFLSGFFERSYELDFDVCVFSMYLKNQDTAKREIGDSNIFNLPDFSRFDGVLIFPDRIRTPGTSEGLFWRIKKEFDGPVLVAEDDIDDYSSINIEHRENVKSLTDHLIDVHGCKDILFLNGIKGNRNSELKRQGFIDSLQNHKIAVDERNIRYGNDWFDTGKQLAIEVMTERERIPDGIICANDYMAMGLAAELEKRGKKIPGDIALAGYCTLDMNDERVEYLTSVDVPVKADGRYAASWFDASFRGAEPPKRKRGTKLHIGKSCGCKACGSGKKRRERSVWEKSGEVAENVSYYNHMLEDLLSQHDYREFYNTIFQYSNAEGDSKSFSLCLNEYWDDPDAMMGNNALRVGYTKNIYRIVKRGMTEAEKAIDFDDHFDVSILIPELDMDRDEPEVFMFTPLNFDDRCFGYAVSSYGGLSRGYDSTYIVKMKQVMQGMEAFYRQAGLQKLIDRMNSSLIRDDLTGVYNYKGFLSKCAQMCEAALENDDSILLVAIDMKGLGQINTRLGRKAGDEAVQNLAYMISSSISPSDVCMRMCNDEFVIAAQVGDDGESYAQSIIDKVRDKAQAFNEAGKEPYSIEIFHSHAIDTVSGMEAFDNNINNLINNKNNTKKMNFMHDAAASELSEEEKEIDAAVADILDNNRLTYYFQPIVNAKTGQIYAYEVLMRASSEKKISPLKIIQSAERMGRLEDVERATFVNVLGLVEDMQSELAGKKVFLNSIPGCNLEEGDAASIEEKMKQFGGKVVVEFTEEAEMNDQTLDRIKDKYVRMNIETAIDDYGAGYSNVNNLLRYMPRYVKIDRMLMTNIHEDTQKQHFVKDIVEFAHDNDIMTLAEGVELEVEMKEAIKLGVDFIQGYYTAKPSPEAVQQIDKKVVTEIVQYNQAEATRYGKKTYVITDEDEISMVQIAFNKYTGLVFRKVGESYRYINMTGTPGFKSNLLITIGDGFKGEIRMDSVSIGGDKGVPCIKLGENCDVRIVLIGDNELRTGGIQVPESSKLELAGDGDLRLTIAGSKYFGIGNDFNSKHGDLYFNQDGTLTISANGMKGIGIGSGLGGNIYITHGRYDIDQRGQEGVAIGCVENDCTLDIQNCDIEIYNGIAHGVVIGSIKGNAEISIENISANISGASMVSTVIGTMEGRQCSINLQSVNIVMNVRAKECYGLGCRKGDTDISIQYAYVMIVAQGKKAYAMGNSIHTARVMVSNSDINTQVTNSIGTDIGADEKDIVIQNGRVGFIVNGMAKERTIIMADL